MSAGSDRATEIPGEELLRRQVLRKVTRRLIPFLCLLYFINILDRVNIGVARLHTMLTDLGMSEKAYALGAGIFFVGYCQLEVPSNLILSRMGARRWMARILVSWGLISTAMMFVTGTWGFILLRFLLGFAEAGFFPGIVLYLSVAYCRGVAVAHRMPTGWLDREGLLSGDSDPATVDPARASGGQDQVPRCLLSHPDPTPSKRITQRQLQIGQASFQHRPVVASIPK